MRQEADEKHHLQCISGGTEVYRAEQFTDGTWGRAAGAKAAKPGSWAALPWAQTTPVSHGLTRKGAVPSQKGHFCGETSSNITFSKSGQLVNTSLAFFFLAVGLRNYLIGRLSSQSFLKLHP